MKERRKEGRTKEGGGGGVEGKKEGRLLKEGRRFIKERNEGRKEEARL